MEADEGGRGEAGGDMAELGVAVAPVDGVGGARGTCVFE